MFTIKIQQVKGGKIITIDKDGIVDIGIYPAMTEEGNKFAIGIYNAQGEFIDRILLDTIYKIELLTKEK